MKRLIIQGSARSEGNTAKVIDLLREELTFDVLELHTKNIGPFDYSFENQEDDFFPVIREIADAYGLLVFATPVYWYTMSGIMKNFFDRITDCLKIEKATGRKLRGKSMAALSCGSDADETEGFFVPFRKSAAYLGMNYLGDVHTWVEGNEPGAEIKRRVRAFADLLR